MELKQLYAIYKESFADSMRWRYYLRAWQALQLKQLFKVIRKPHLIPLAVNSKRPIQGCDFEYSLSFNEALLWLGAGHNLGLIAGKCSPKVIVYDFDNEPSEPAKALMQHTLTVKTLRGYHLYLLDKGEPDIGLLATALQSDTPRREIMYVLIPPSQINKQFYTWHILKPPISIFKAKRIIKQVISHA